MSIAHVGALEPRARIYEAATHLFSHGAWRGLQCLTLARHHGERAVLEALDLERRRAEDAGSWGSWPRFHRALTRQERLYAPLSDRRRKARRIAPSPPRAARAGGGGL